MKKKITFTDQKTMTLMLGYLCVATEIEAGIVRKVQILDRFQLDDSDIAAICNCGVQSVRDARQKLKRKK